MPYIFSEIDQTASSQTWWRSGIKETPADLTGTPSGNFFATTHGLVQTHPALSAATLTGDIIKCNF